MVMRSNLRWCSEGLEFACWNGEIVRMAFIIDAFDREIVVWTAGSDSARCGLHPIEPLSDKRSPYTAKEMRDFAMAPNLVPCFTAARSPEARGMSEAFVKAFKRDYLLIDPLPDAAMPLQRIAGWTDDYTKSIFTQRSGFVPRGSSSELRPYSRCVW